MSTAEHHLPKSHRRGAIYLAVLSVSLIIGIIGITAMHVARLELRETVASKDITCARLAAESGVEFMLNLIDRDASWRTNLVHGTVAALNNSRNVLDQTGTWEYMLTDTDGNLADNTTDSVALRVIGTCGDARSVLEVQLQPAGVGLDCLATSMHTDGDLIVYDTLTTNQTVSSNSDIDASSGTINGDAQAAGSVMGTATGAITNGMAPLAMPDPNNVFDYYLSRGTVIPVSDIPGKLIDRTILSATHNPFGAGTTNPEGIYIIDCQGSDLKIRRSRLAATVVCINVGLKVTVDKNVLWEPTVPNFPVLLVEGIIELKLESTPLSESGEGVNFNPAHTPYNEMSDSDLMDNYASEIRGLVYCTNRAQVINGSTSIAGVLVVGIDAEVNGPLTLQYDSTYYDNAPPGFAAGSEMRIVPGSWQRTAY